MNYDLYASSHCEDRTSISQRVTDDTIDVPTRIRLLASAVVGKDKEYARGEYQGLVYSGDDSLGTPYARHIAATREQWLTPLSLWQPPTPDFAMLPAFSAFLQFEFALARPYLGRDDEPLYIHDNPVRKDKVFQVPLATSTGWKGCLRAAATRQLVQEWRQRDQDTQLLASGRLRLARLFGDEKGEETDRPREMAAYLAALSAEADEMYRDMVRRYFRASSGALPHHAGRLSFYPTFFDRLGLEVINPHKRATRAGDQPLYFESAPAGATGIFSLLYVPFDRIGQDEAETCGEVAADLKVIGRATQAMLIRYGFGAKTRNGFGTADLALPQTGSLYVSAQPQPYTFDRLAPKTGHTSLAKAASTAADDVEKGVKE